MIQIRIRKVELYALQLTIDQLSFLSGILIYKTFFFFPCFRFKNITGTFFHFKFFGLEVKHKKCDTGM